MYRVVKKTIDSTKSYSDDTKFTIGDKYTPITIQNTNENEEIKKKCYIDNSWWKAININYANYGKQNYENKHWP